MKAKEKRDFCSGCFKLLLMVVISLGMYHYIKGFSLVMVTEESINQFLLNLKANDMNMSQSVFDGFFNLINYSLRVAIVSVFVYTVAHWSFDSFEFNPLFYSVFAYTMQQSYFVYQYIQADKSTELVLNLALTKVTYLSIGAALACIIYNMTVRVPKTTKLKRG